MTIELSTSVLPQFTRKAYQSSDYPEWLQQIVRDILQARIYDLAIKTPLEQLQGLSAKTGNRLYLKREDLQPVFSFKLRGAYNRIRQLPADIKRRGIVCASAGNHAQGVAVAAQKLGIRAVIVMPATTPEIKVEAVAARGAEVVLEGDSFDQALVHARSLQKKHGLEFIHPYDDPSVIAGQGTVGMEILQQAPEDLHAIFVPVGGGGLAAGVGAYVKYLQPNVRVIGVESVDAASMKLALEQDNPTSLPQVGLFADGIAVKQVGAMNFQVCREVIDDIITVTPDEMCAAIKDIFEATRSISEPSGAVAVAGMKKYAALLGRNDLAMAAVSSGANMNFDRLRHIAERTAIGEQREALFAVQIPEQVGSFRKLCRALGKVNVTEFNYRYSRDHQDASIFLGVQVTGAPQRQTFYETLRQQGYELIDLTDNELAKEHLRHTVGGRAARLANEHLFRFVIPERPNSLRDFLDAIGQEWDISLFHYRNHGTDYGRILVGLDVPPQSAERFRQQLAQLSYPWEDETQNPGYQRFLR